MTNIPQEWLALVVFVAVSVLTWLLLGRVLPGVLRHRRQAGNVVRLNGSRRRPQRRRRRLPRIHPLAWLIGLAVLAYGYMLQVDEGPPRAGARMLTGSVTHVRDGDTIEVSGVPIRFAGLDCAELGTAAGERAKQQMVSLVAGRQLQCDLTGRRSYDRMIGECEIMAAQSLFDIVLIASSDRDFTHLALACGNGGCLIGGQAPAAPDAVNLSIFCERKCDLPNLPGRTSRIVPSHRLSDDPRIEETALPPRVGLHQELPFGNQGRLDPGIEARQRAPEV